MERWLRHAACEPNDVMVKHLLFAHSIPSHPRPMGRPHPAWMAMHDMATRCRYIFCETGLT